MRKFRWVAKIENSIECFKEKYKKLPLYEKILDMTLIIAVTLTIIFFTLEHTIIKSSEVIHILQRADMVLGIVFVADFVRTFKKSGHWITFLKHHWIDGVAILLFMALFTTVVYPGAGRLSYLLRTMRLHKVTQFYHLKHATQVVS